MMEEEKRERDVTRAINNLEVALKKASTIADEIIGRLSGVLSPSNPQCEDAEAAAYNTELGRFVGDQTQTALSIIERLEDTLKRLEV